MVDALLVGYFKLLKLGAVGVLECDSFCGIQWDYMD